MTESYMFKLFSDDQIQFIDENAGKIKLHLSIDEASESVRVKLQSFSKVLWSGKYLARPKLIPEGVLLIRTYFKVPEHLELQPTLLDQARIHPRYARHFNQRYQLLHQLLFNEEESSQEAQLSYGEGLSFIGNAILRFVAAILVFYDNPEDTPNEILEDQVRHMMNVNHLANLCEESGWDLALAYNSKKLSLNCKKGEKVYSDQLKGFLGALYASNSTESLPEILEVAKKMLSPETELSFEGLVKQDFDRNSLVLGGCVGFGVGMFAMVMASYLWMYHGML